MKKGIILLVLIGATVFGGYSLIGSVESERLAGTDKYKVIKVDGKIVFETTRENMKKGDVFLSGMSLSFATPQSRAAVISSVKGRFVLSASEKGKTKILPAANNVSSRAGALINMIDLQNHFSGKYLVLGKMELELGKEAFPMNDESFFYLSYAHNDEQIRKKLKSNDNKLVLSQEDIFKIDGKAIPVEEKEMTLYYRNEGQSTKVSAFTPVFPDNSDLRDEIAIILQEFDGKDDKLKVKEVTSYLNEFYGSPQKENLAKWLEAEFNIK
ncbi:MAG: hypothetical protein ACI857_001612 [Arenicella sp.]|jgi:hypothetical protein